VAIVVAATPALIARLSGPPSPLIPVLVSAFAVGIGVFGLLLVTQGLKQVVHVMLAFSLAAAGVAGLTVQLVKNAPVTVEPAAIITNPADGSTVDALATLRGSVWHVDNASQLWVTVHIVGPAGHPAFVRGAGQFFWPFEIVVDGSSWSSTAVFGDSQPDKAGLQFEATLLHVSPADAEFLKTNMGKAVSVNNLPKSRKELAQINLTRR
jgi:hypothetical protein